MVSELKKIISFVFNRSGKTELSFSDLYLSLSFELRWFNPNDAKNFIKIAINKNLLNKKGDLFSPSFDFVKIPIQKDFSPSKEFNFYDENFIENEILNISDKLINKIVEKTGIKISDILKEIKVYEKKFNVTNDIATLLIAKKFDITLNEYYEEIEKNIIKNED